MKNIHAQRALLAASAGVATLVAGCQTYAPSPVDLSSHHDTWVSRSAGDEPVRELADRLGAAWSPGEFDLTDGLSLSEAELVALVYNPSLRLARLRADVAQATAENAGLWSDPEFSIDVLHITESVDDPWILSPGLALTIPISGRLGAEQARADAALAAALAAVAEDEWAIRVELRREWARWSAARVRAERVETLLASVDSLSRSTQRLAREGEMLRTEAALFSLEGANLGQLLLRHRGELREREQSLRAIMGLAPTAAVEFEPLLALRAPSVSAQSSLVERNLKLERLRLEYDVAESALRREVRKQYPDLTIGPLYESDDGQSRIGFLGALPLPFLNANRQGITEARAERELARAAYESTYETLAGELAMKQSRLESLREQRELVESRLVPLADRQLADAQRLLELGEGGGLVLLESLTRAGQTQMLLIEARLAEAVAIADLCELLGPPALNAPSSSDITSQPSDEVSQ